MKIIYLASLLFIPQILCMENDEPTKLAPFFDICVHMNELNLEKHGYVNKAEFGERIGYLIGHPLECWNVPVTKIEKIIIRKWVQKLYAHKDNELLHYMIEDLFLKIVCHDQLYTSILNLLQPDEEQGVQKEDTIITYMRFKHMEYMTHANANKKNTSWWCTIL